MSNLYCFQVPRLYADISVSISICKVWGLEKNTNLNSIFCLIKSSEIVFIFLPAFYLIMWVLTHQRILKKYSFLKIWQLVFFLGVKTYFGELTLKLCIFRHGKNWFSQITHFWRHFWNKIDAKKSEGVTRTGLQGGWEWWLKEESQREPMGNPEKRAGNGD